MLIYLLLVLGALAAGAVARTFKIVNETSVASSSRSVSSRP